MKFAIEILGAQTGSLLYRRLATCGGHACRLPVGDTADCQSALQPKL